MTAVTPQQNSFVSPEEASPEVGPVRLGRGLDKLLEQQGGGFNWLTGDNEYSREKALPMIFRDRPVARLTTMPAFPGDLCAAQRELLIADLILLGLQTELNQERRQRSPDMQHVARIVHAKAGEEALGARLRHHIRQLKLRDL